jgi:tetratricopeptide (TPR) repeat protein
MYDQAISDCIQAIEQDPRYTSSYLLPGQRDGKTAQVGSSIASYDPDEAIRNKALQLHPQGSYSYGSSPEKHRFDQAYTDCTQAVEFDPRYAPVYVMRGAGFEETGQHELAIAEYDKAKKLYSQAIEQDPQDAVAYYGRGLADLKTGERRRAISDYNKAIELDPRNVNAYIGRALAHHAIGQIRAAIADYNRAIELDPGNVNAHIGRGNIFIERDRLTDAIADYNKAIEFDPQNSYAYGARANAYEKLGQLDRALADCSQAIKLDPRQAAAYIVRGNVYDDQGQTERAIDDYTTALELNHQEFDAYNALAWIKATTAEPRYRDGREAIRLARRALELQLKPGDRIEVLDTLAAAYVASGEPDEALKHYEEAMQAGGRMRVALYQKDLKDKGRYQGRVNGAYSADTRNALLACVQAGCQLGVQ